MADINIGVFSTQKLANNSEFATGDSLYAARVARTYIEGTLNYTNYTYDVQLERDKFPNPPKEPPGASVTDDLCNTGSEKSHNTVWNWFVDRWKYSSCKDPHLDVDDVYLLLTGSEGGGLGTRKTAAAGALDLINLEITYNHFGYGDKFFTVDTVLEEIGHCLISNMSDEDGDGSGHDSGMVKQDPSTGEMCISPMGLKEYQTYTALNYQENNRDTPYNKDAVNNGRVAEYSDCTVNHFSV